MTRGDIKAFIERASWDVEKTQEQKMIELSLYIIEGLAGYPWHVLDNQSKTCGTDLAFLVSNELRKIAAEVRR